METSAVPPPTRLLIKVCVLSCREQRQDLQVGQSFANRRHGAISVQPPQLPHDCPGMLHFPTRTRGFQVSEF